MKRRFLLLLGAPRATVLGTGKAAALVAAVATVAALAWPATSLAATYTVNTTADNAANQTECSGVALDCSLRQALDKATSGDTVSVPASATPYQVTSTPISIPAGVTIVGSGATATTITGGGTNQIFTVSSGGPVSISALTLTDGLNNDLGDEAGALWITSGDVTLDQVQITNSSSPDWGGGIEDDGGNLTITRSRFSGDTAGTAGGGAIDFYAGGVLTVSDTVFAGNSSSSFAGAVVVEPEATYALNRVTFDGNSVSASSSSGGGAFEGEGGGTIYNSTFSGNSAPEGGALWVNNAGSETATTSTAINDTFANNSAPTGANVVVVSGGSFSTQNSIFASPQGGGGNCSGTVTDLGNNLEDTSPSTCGFTAASNDLVGQSPQLAAALADNGSTVATPGGPPQTLALASNSPAVGKASATGCQTVGSVDERGVPRPGVAGLGCDIGAFESQTPPAPVGAAPSPPAVAAGAPVVKGSSGAAFSGTVNPDGQATTAHFEYGLDPKYSGGGPVVYSQTTATQTVGSDDTAHAVIATVAGLVPNALYHVRLVAANSSGTVDGPDQTFTTAKAPAPPPPVIGQSANVTPVSGLVLIKPPPGKSFHGLHGRVAGVPTKGQGFIPLTQARQVPVGSQVDALRGTLQLIVASTAKHKTQQVRLTGGVFSLSQARKGPQKGLTTFALMENAFKGAPSYASCTSGKKLAHGALAVGGPLAQAAKLKPKVLQTLLASEKSGKFQTKGRYSSATVRGTEWETEDRCDGTLTAVKRGVVAVQDFHTRKTIVLRAGHSFLAKP
jgi:hypothetical protein